MPVGDHPVPLATAGCVRIPPRAHVHIPGRHQRRREGRGRGDEAAGHMEVLNVKVHVFILLLFASLPDCTQNQTAVSDTLKLLSDF